MPLLREFSLPLGTLVSTAKLTVSQQICACYSELGGDDQLNRLLFTAFRHPWECFMLGARLAH